MRTRRAVPDDAHALSELAFASKQTWGYPPEWMELWRHELTLTPEFIAEQMVWAAWEGEQPVGMVALGRAAEVWVLEHLFVAPEALGRGLGRQLFDLARAAAASVGAHAIEVLSDPNAEEFYRRLGAIRVGTVESTPAGRTLPKLRLDLESVE